MNGRHAAPLLVALLSGCSEGGCFGPPAAQPSADQPATVASNTARLEDGAGANPLHEEVVRVPLEGSGVTLEMTTFRPRGPGPFPLVVMNHGAIGRANPTPRWRPLAHVRWFVGRGFAVAVPMRRGNAGSGGEWAEGYGPCASADYTRADAESASDIRAALSFMKRRPYVDAHRVVLHGASAGGLAVLSLASTAPEGVVGVLVFAGGRGSLTENDGRSRHNCAPAALVMEAARLGATTRVPTLWLYATNDSFFPPPLAHEMFDAFVREGAHGKFVALPAFDGEGHHAAFAPEAIKSWAGAVDAFLADLRLGASR